MSEDEAATARTQRSLSWRRWMRCDATRTAVARGPAQCVSGSRCRGEGAHRGGSCQRVRCSPPGSARHGTAAYRRGLRHVSGIAMADALAVIGGSFDDQSVTFIWLPSSDLTEPSDTPTRVCQAAPQRWHDTRRSTQLPPRVVGTAGRMTVGASSPGSPAAAHEADCCASSADDSRSTARF